MSRIDIFSVATDTPSETGCVVAVPAGETTAALCREFRVTFPSIRQMSAC